jgi:hypothetical protein
MEGREAVTRNPAGPGAAQNAVRTPKTFRPMAAMTVSHARHIGIP